MIGDRPAEPVTWCRIFAVGAPCRFPCADCKRTNAALAQLKPIKEKS